MSNGEWTVLGIFIGLLVGMGVYNTLVINRILRVVSLPKTAHTAAQKWDGGNNNVE